MRNENWNIENIKTGIQKYFLENGSYPTSRDFDKCSYLPTARQIQRRFGGLEKLRELVDLNLPLNYTKGKIRSDKVKNIIKESYEYEESFYKWLLTKYAEVAIHEQKRLRPGNIASDFYIYTENNGQYAIDIFYAKDLFSVSNVVNIKLKRYTQISKIKIYFIVIGDIIQIDLEKLMLNRKNKLPDNIIVITEQVFKSSV